MHDPAERGNVSDAFADRVSDGFTQPDADNLSDAIAFADRAPVIRSAQRAVGRGRVGIGRGYAPLQVVGPRRYVDGAVAPARSLQHRGLLRGRDKRPSP